MLQGLQGPQWDPGWLPQQGLLQLTPAHLRWQRVIQAYEALGA